MLSSDMKVKDANGNMVPVPVSKATSEFTAMEGKSMEKQYKKKGRISGTSVGAGGALRHQKDAGYMPVDKGLSDYAQFLYTKSKLAGKETEKFLPALDFKTEAMMDYVVYMNQIVQTSKRSSEDGRTARNLLVQLKNVYQTESIMEIANELAQADDDAVTMADNKYAQDMVINAKKTGKPIDFSSPLY
jgi:hypothetical protein